MVSTKKFFFGNRNFGNVGNRNVENFEISRKNRDFEIFDFRNFRNFDFRNFEKSKKIPKFDIFFKDFFRHDFFCLEKYFLPISTRNFPKIPKIVLRKSCDEPKHAKTPRDR